MVGYRTKTEQDKEPQKPPKLARRRENRKSTFRLGRTIGEKREKLETSNERKAARKKDKRRKISRLLLTTGVFLGIIAILAILLMSFLQKEESEIIIDEPEDLSPTIEIIDEDLGSNSRTTSRMNLFIARVEKEFGKLGYHPIKAVIPRGAIREVDFYLENHPGYVKTIVGRNPAVTVEDADRMIRYLSGQGIVDYAYIDVRIDGKAYWK